MAKKLPGYFRALAVWRKGLTHCPVKVFKWFNGAYRCLSFDAKESARPALLSVKTTAYGTISAATPRVTPRSDRRSGHVLCRGAAQPL